MLYLLLNLLLLNLLLLNLLLLNLLYMLDWLLNMLYTLLRLHALIAHGLLNYDLLSTMIMRGLRLDVDLRSLSRLFYVKVWGLRTHRDMLS